MKFRLIPNVNDYSKDMIDIVTGERRGQVCWASVHIDAFDLYNDRKDLYDMLRAGKEVVVDIVFPKEDEQYVDEEN